MTDSTQFEEFRKWHQKNRYIFHWKVSAGVSQVMHVFVEMPSKNDAKRLASALRRRGVDASTGYRTLSIGPCVFGTFLQALAAVKIDWEDFKEWVSMLYFDGEKHITGKEIKP